MRRGGALDQRRRGYLSRLAWGTALLLVAAPGVSTGQTVTGRVVDSLSAKPLERAVIYFDRETVDLFSRADGWFRIDRPTPADTILVVRRIGYVPTRVRVPYSASASEIDLGPIRLRAVATKLDQIAIEAEEVKRYPQLEDFYRRRARLTGFFMTPEEIARASARKPSNLVERTVRVKTGCNDVGAGRWQKGAPFDCTALNSRPQGAVVGGAVTVVNCEMDIWLNGQRSPFQLDEIPVKEIVALEVYSGPATTPPMYASGHCGVVAIWTNGGQAQN